ncbi:MAG: GH3 auxin-responsive promoter family protein [Bacteroidetes bacterium]|nr:MAG: GH3 auxin-responsive promoter family protein [Bacteroidota bacterium]
MALKSLLAKLFAWWVHLRKQRWLNDPMGVQIRIMHQLLKSAESTRFGKDHGFGTINTYEDFKKKVPIRDYEQFKPYIEHIKHGELDVLWPGKPLYFCKTSGTTSGVKYIPLTKESLPNHINSARNALLSYIHETGKADFVKGKMIFIQGSPELDEISGIRFGRLSGIVAHHVPAYLLKNRMPSYETNCIEDWEQKIDKIVEETSKENMTLISGIPAWVQMYFERLQEKNQGKKIKDIFPNFKLLVFGGVNFEPYSKRFNELIGGQIDSIEIYPASEGFFAYQDKRNEKGLLLLLNEGIFYEFIPVEEVFSDQPTRLSIGEVELNKNYALVVNSNAGLWGYLIGDTVRFTSLKPHRIVVSGRIKHYISAFGEHVIGEEVEGSLTDACNELNIQIEEFTVAPMVLPENGEPPFHEWFIEFRTIPENLAHLASLIDEGLQKRNPYYRDLIEGGILQTLKIHAVPKGTFTEYMRSQGKLGGQNKMVRLSNDRKIAEDLLSLTHNN